MKKIISFLFFVLFLSCSSSEDNLVSTPQQAPDQIIGKWKLQKEEFYNSNNVLINTTYPDVCFGQSYTDYKINNTLSTYLYDTNSSNVCELQTNYLEYGYWEKLNNGKYKHRSKYVGENEEITELDIEFIDNGNTYKSKSINSNPSLGYSYQIEYYTKFN